MTQKDFNNISIRGRAAYGISCLNIYIKNVYPNSDFTTALDFACRITEDSDYIDESVMAFTEIIPEYLFEFDNYTDSEFEYLSEDQYNHLITTIPKNDDDLNLIMNSIRNIVWECCYVDMEPFAPASSKHLIEIIKVMKKHSLKLPDLNSYIKYSFNENDGWGSFITRDNYL